MVETARRDPDPPVSPEPGGPVVTVHAHLYADTRISSSRPSTVQDVTVLVFDGTEPLTADVVLYARRPELERLGVVLDAALADLDTDPAARGDVGGVS